MEDQTKCSNEEHKEMNAIIFCPEYKLYMCNKCENHHATLHKKHCPYKLNNYKETFTGFCKEKNHPNKLEFYCKNHNQLCCAACITKLNEKGYGKHKDCEVCILEKIKDEKKNKLKENIKCLEDFNNKFNEAMNKLKEFLDKKEKGSENLKLIVQNTFTKIRNALNDRENQLLLEIDNIYKEKYFNEDIIKKGEILPKQIKLSLNNRKLIDKEWENNNLYSYINDCINIEKNIKDINIIEQTIIKCEMNNQIKINFSPNEYSFKKNLQYFNSFGKIYFNWNYQFKECPKNINDIRAYTTSGEKKNILTKTGQKGWMGTICENELDKSIEEHKWKIKLSKVTNKELMVGIAPNDFNIKESTYKTCGWYFYCNGSKLYYGPPYNGNNMNSGLSAVNDEIIVVTNMKKRTLKFIINNEDKGESYCDIPIDKPLFPAVFLFYQYDSIEISECN